ncbi:MAG: hypothetical protein LBD37_03490 [Treponema sp.]|jgi:hypothetical protein|nr:hypothetical protein [Treponema sp.]
MADIVYSAEFQVSLDKLKKAFIEAQGDMEKFAKLAQEAFFKPQQEAKGLTEIISDHLPESIKKAISGFKELKKAIELKFANKDIIAIGKSLKESFGAGVSKAKEFVNSLKSGLASSTKSLLEFAKSHGKLDWKNHINGVKSFVSSLVSGMAGGVKAAIQFGIALNAATGGLLLIIGAVVGLIAVIGKMAASQGEYNRNLEVSKKAHEGIGAVIKRNTFYIEQQEKKISEVNKAQQVSPVILSKTAGILQKVLLPHADTWRKTIQKAYELQQKILGLQKDMAIAMGMVTEEELKTAAITQINKKENAAVVEAKKKIWFETQKILMMENDIVKQEEAKLSAMDSLIDVMAEQLVLMKAEDTELKGQLETLKKKRDELGKNLEANKNINAAIDSHKLAIDKILLTETDATKQKEAQLSALNTYIDSLAEEAALMKGQNKIREDLLNFEIKMRVEARDKLMKELESEKEITEELTEQEKITKARNEAEERYNETLRRVREQLETGRITEEEAKTQRAAAMEAWADDLRGIVDEYNLIEGATVKLLGKKEELAGLAKRELRHAQDQAKLAAETRKAAEDFGARQEKFADDQKAAAGDLLDVQELIAQQEIDRLKTQAENTGSMKEQESLYEQAYEKEVALLIQQRARALENYKLTDSYKAMADEGEGSAEEFEEAWQKATDGMVAGIKKGGKAAAVSVKDIAEQAVAALGAALDLMTQLAQQDAASRIEGIEKDLEATKEEIDEFYEKERERLEEERQKALEAAGFAAATSAEGLEAAMQAAMDSMDAQVIYREKQRQKELAINRDFDTQEAALEEERKAKEEAAEKEAAQRKLDIQYEADMIEWKSNLIKGGADIAMGIIKAWSQGGGVMGAVLAALVTVAGAFQMAGLIAAQPKKQTLASGGIVEGTGPRGVDSVDAMLAPKEMVLNDQQQSNLFSMIQQGGGGSLTLVTILEVNGQTMAQVTTEAINDGFGQLINRVRLA